MSVRIAQRRAVMHGQFLSHCHHNLLTIMGLSNLCRQHCNQSWQVGKWMGAYTSLSAAELGRHDQAQGLQEAGTDKGCALELWQWV